MSQTNGTTHEYTADEAIDSLYSFWPGTTPAPQPCPEALFSLTLKGTIGGHEALLTARGQTAEEFTRNLDAIRGLLDAKPQASPPPVEASSQGQDGFCLVHNTAMQLNEKHGAQWWSHKKADGSWCKGRTGR